MPIDDPRQRLALALDVDDLVLALRMARRLRPWFGLAKVGFELFAAAGPEVVCALTVEGYRVFLDLKLHDIPTTVRRAARVIGGLGATYTTVHTTGGEEMLRASLQGMAEGAAAAGAGVSSPE
jgi:orotidine-5'-phosphate decarboxylase